MCIVTAGWSSYISGCTFVVFSVFRIGVLFFFFFFFFFQAEDGIRDAQESRGLGDVYKRQVGYSDHEFDSATSTRDQDVTSYSIAYTVSDSISVSYGTDELSSNAVSYTHLTLPTNREV